MRDDISGQSFHEGCEFSSEEMVKGTGIQDFKLDRDVVRTKLAIPNGSNDIGVFGKETVKSSGIVMAYHVANIAMTTFGQVVAFKIRFLLSNTDDIADWAI